MDAAVRNSMPSALMPARRAWLLCAALLVGSATLLHAADIQVPLPQVLAEADSLVKARKLSDAAQLIDTVLARVDKGESLPAGVSLDKLQLLQANNYFQLGQYDQSAAVAQKLLTRVPAGQPAAEARLILGLALALQKKFAEAVPVFGDLVESVTYHDKALMYRAMAAQQAGQTDIAIDSLNRLLATAPHNADWADSALTLISLELQKKDLAAAARGLALLRGNLKIVDNLAGLNALGLQLGDALLAAKDPAGALAAYRMVLSREELVRLQTARIAAMQARLARQKDLYGASPAVADESRRLAERIKSTQAALAEIDKTTDYDAALYYRLGHTFLQRGGDWEAALAFEKLLKDFPGAASKEGSYLELVQAYANAGRLDRVQDALARFTAALPDSKLLPQALFIAAQAASDKKRPDLELKFLGQGIDNFPKAELTEYMLLTKANACFTAGKFAEAQAAAVRYLKDYPDGKFAEDAAYLNAMASLVLGNASAALKQIDAYLAKYPEGRFVSDARYRSAAADYALENYASAETKLDAWLKTYPDTDPLRSQVLSTQGDVFTGEDKNDQAIASYRAALVLPMPDSLLGYVLDQLTQLYQGKRDYTTAAAMWADFAHDHPDHPFVINAAYWIGRLRTKEGRTDEAIGQMSEIARRYLADPSRDTVERLLSQIALVIARPAKKNPDGTRPAPLTDDQVNALVEQDLVTPDTRDNPTVRARVWFTEAEVASFRKNTALRDQLLAKVGALPPDALPPGLLGVVGDYLLGQNQPEQARAFYAAIVKNYAGSIYADYGYVGLGELAYQAGEYDTALARFNDAIDLAGARFKLLPATLGRAKTLLALGKLDASRTLFEQIASNRQWRGEATAQSVWSLGAILLKQGGRDNLAAAEANFQRVYITYRKYPVWVARAYLSGGQTFEKLGQLKEALATYREMLADTRLSAFPEYAQAQARVSVLAAQLPAADSTAPVTGPDAGGAR